MDRFTDTKGIEGLETALSQGATGFVTSVTVSEGVVFTKIKNTGVRAALRKGLVSLSLRCLTDVVELFDP